MSKKSCICIHLYIVSILWWKLDKTSWTYSLKCKCIKIWFYGKESCTHLLEFLDRLRYRMITKIWLREAAKKLKFFLVALPLRGPEP